MDNRKVALFLVVVGFFVLFIESSSLSEEVSIKELGAEMYKEAAKLSISLTRLRSSVVKKISECEERKKELEAIKKINSAFYSKVRRLVYPRPTFSLDLLRENRAKISSDLERINSNLAFLYENLEDIEIFALVAEEHKIIGQILKELNSVSFREDEIKEMEKDIYLLKKTREESEESYVSVTRLNGL